MALPLADAPFHDRDGFIWLDGEMVPWREAQLHVLSHGLHYASSVFEGVRCYNGKVFKLTEHSQRLIDSGKALGFKNPFTVEQLNAATEEVTKVNNLPNCYLRPIAWKGSNQMGVINTRGEVHVAIAAWHWDYIGAELWEKGLRLCEARFKRCGEDFFPTTVKAAGMYTINTLNKNYATERGYDDTLVLGQRGTIAESTSANMFLVIDGELHTPIPDCFLNGITRQTIIGLAESFGIPVHVRDIPVDDLAKAQEVFLTGTAVEMTPVAAIDLPDRQFKFQVGGPVELKLIEAFRELTGKSAKVVA